MQGHDQIIKAESESQRTFLVAFKEPLDSCSEKSDSAEKQTHLVDTQSSRAV